MNESLSTPAHDSDVATRPAPDTSMPGAAIAIAGLAGAALLGAAIPAQAVSPALRFRDIPGSGVFKVLNFALSLEDLETELYVQAVQRLTDGGRGGRDAPPGTNIPGLGLSDTARDVFFTRKFTTVETEHRDFLRTAITRNGGTPISPFKYEFNMARLSRKEVINLIFTAERTGVSAYLGAIPFFPGINDATRPFIQIAAAIQGTEARHTAIFADILNDQFGVNVDVAPQAKLNGGRDQAIPPDAVLASVSPFINTDAGIPAR